MHPDGPAPAHEVRSALQGLRGPVITSVLVAAATRAGARPPVIYALRRLPERVWDDVDQAIAALDAAPGQRHSSRASRPRVGS